MPKIMIRCPTVGKAVPTGLTTEKIKFEVTGGGHDTAPLPRLLENPQMGEKGSVGRKGRLSERNAAAGRTDALELGSSLVSALPPKTTELLRRREMTRRAQAV